jgi:hypothetical protein
MIAVGWTLCHPVAADAQARPIELDSVDLAVFVGRVARTVSGPSSGWLSSRPFDPT